MQEHRQKGAPKTKKIDKSLTLEEEEENPDGFDPQQNDEEEFWSQKEEEEICQEWWRYSQEGPENETDKIDPSEIGAKLTK